MFCVVGVREHGTATQGVNQRETVWPVNISSGFSPALRIRRRRRPQRSGAYCGGVILLLASRSKMRGFLVLITIIPVAVLVLNIAGTFSTPQRQRRIRFAATSFQAERQRQLSSSGREPDFSSPPPPPTALPEFADCNGTEHAELWGALVVAGPENIQPSARDCCASCRLYEPTLDVLHGAQCNAWVWSPESRVCWLKHQRPEELAHAVKMLAERRSKPNPKIAWTSGVWLETKPCRDCIAPAFFVGCIGKDRCNTSRLCGSPAIDGYSHVDPACVARSPTALRYKQLQESGTPLVAYHELHADYDGLGVRWGIGHKKARWEDCEASCREFRPSARGGGPFGGLPCNVWTWCSQPVCFEPDAHKHSFGDCWHKFTELPEAPEVNMRHPMRASFMQRHRNQMKDGVTWHSGALLPPGVKWTNGTWGPRAYW